MTMKQPPFKKHLVPTKNHAPSAEGLAKGDVHAHVKHDKRADGEVHPDAHELDVKAAPRAKDLDNAASGEGMNLDFPNTAVQDRYQPISPMRMRALGIAKGK